MPSCRDLMSSNASCFTPHRGAALSKGAPSAVRNVSACADPQHHTASHASVLGRRLCGHTPHACLSFAVVATRPVVAAA